jgi:hypothetical protein
LDYSCFPLPSSGFPTPGNGRRAKRPGTKEGVDKIRIDEALEILEDTL